VGASGVTLGRRLRLLALECVCTTSLWRCTAARAMGIAGAAGSGPGPRRPDGARSSDGVSAARDGGRVVLRWTNPVAADLAGVIVRWSPGPVAPGAPDVGKAAHPSRRVTITAPMRSGPVRGAGGPSPQNVLDKIAAVRSHATLCPGWHLLRADLVVRQSTAPPPLIRS
jgi:hypothetical protein